MLIFGTAGKTIQHQLDPQHVLLVTYRYFHIFWLLRCAYGKRYELATGSQDGWARRPLSEEEARGIAGDALPKPNPWDQWSLLGALVIILIVAVLPSLVRH